MILKHYSILLYSIIIFSILSYSILIDRNNLFVLTANLRDIDNINYSDVFNIFSKQKKLEERFGAGNIPIYSLLRWLEQSRRASSNMLISTGEAKTTTWCGHVAPRYRLLRLSAHYLLLLLLYPPAW